MEIGDALNDLERSELEAKYLCDELAIVLDALRAACTDYQSLLSDDKQEQAAPTVPDASSSSSSTHAVSEVSVSQDTSKAGPSNIRASGQVARATTTTTARTAPNSSTRPTQAKPRARYTHSSKPAQRKIGGGTRKEKASKTSVDEDAPIGDGRLEAVLARARRIKARTAQSESPGTTDVTLRVEREERDTEAVEENNDIVKEKEQESARVTEDDRDDQRERRVDRSEAAQGTATKPLGDADVRAGRAKVDALRRLLRSCRMTADAAKLAAQRECPAERFLHDNIKSSTPLVADGLIPPSLQDSARVRALQSVVKGSLEHLANRPDLYTYQRPRNGDLPSFDELFPTWYRINSILRVNKQLRSLIQEGKTIPQVHLERLLPQRGTPLARAQTAKKFPAVTTHDTAACAHVAALSEFDGWSHVIGRPDLETAAVVNHDSVYHTKSPHTASSLARTRHDVQSARVVLQMTRVQGDILLPLLHSAASHVVEAKKRRKDPAPAIRRFTQLLRTTQIALSDARSRAVSLVAKPPPRHKNALYKI